MTERAECIDPSLGILRERRIPVLRMTSVEIKGRRIHSGRIRAGEGTCPYVDRDGTYFPALRLQIERDKLTDIYSGRRGQTGQRTESCSQRQGARAWVRRAQAGFDGRRWV